ncbi:diguanylate cyclase [Pannonibacter sp. Pt2-lr]
MIEEMLAQPDLATLAPVSHEVEFRQPPGLVRRFKIAGHGSVNQLGEPVVQGVLQDITDAYNSQLDLWRAAHFDQITKLGNRYHFNEELSGRTDPEGTAPGFFLFIIDLDGFKAVNDTHGHRAGDEVLKEVSRRISLYATSGSFRLGGDEFALIIDAQPGTDTAKALAQHLLTDIARPIDIVKETVCVSASIGISHYPSDGCESDLLLHAADCAMYAAKKNGRISLRCSSLGRRQASEGPVRGRVGRLPSKNRRSDPPVSEAGAGDCPPCLTSGGSDSAQERLDAIAQVFRAAGGLGGVLQHVFCRL